MNALLAELRANFPRVTFDGGDDSLGYWLSARFGEWQWMRTRVTNIECLRSFALYALRDAVRVGVKVYD